MDLWDLHKIRKVDLRELQLIRKMDLGDLLKIRKMDLDVCTIVHLSEGECRRAVSSSSEGCLCHDRRGHELPDRTGRSAEDEHP